MSFDPKLLIPMVRKLAAENPDFVYEPIARHPDSDGGGPKCSYVHGDCGGCIVGQAALLSGLPLDELRELDNDEEDTSASVQFERFGLSTEDLVWLSRVQHYQDTGFPWGRAVMAADEDELKRAVGK